MACPLCNDTGEQRYWEGRWRDADKENKTLLALLTAARALLQHHNAAYPDEIDEALSAGQ